MKRTVTVVFSSSEVLNILARHIIASRDIELVPESKIVGELMAVAGRDESGEVVLAQYRLEIVVEEARESWRG